MADKRGYQVIPSNSKKVSKQIKALRTFFTVSVAAFEMQHTILEAFGHKANNITHMHALHIKARNEANQKDPDMKVLNRLIYLMEREAKRNSNNSNTFKQ